MGSDCPTSNTEGCFQQDYIDTVEAAALSEETNLQKCHDGDVVSPLALLYI